MTIKTYRGKLKDGAKEQIRLKTNTGKIGYRIVKFQVMSDAPTTVSAECVVKIFKVPQTTVTAKINFKDNNLLAVALWTSDSDTHEQAEDMNVIFDKEIFNQDIYITHENTAGGAEDCNYYIELEQVTLNDNESTMATLQSIRSRYESYTPAGPS